MAINRIELIVHPAYRQVHDAYDRRLNPSEKHLLKNTFHTAGEIMFQVRKDRHSLLVFVPTEISTKFETLKPFRKQQEKFIARARKVLGERFVVLMPAFGVSSKYWHNTPNKDTIRKLRKYKFDENVKLNATGEYRDDCVPRSARKIETMLTGRKGRKVTTALRPDARGMFQAKELTGQAAVNELTAFSKWRRKVYGKRVPAPRRRI